MADFAQWSLDAIREEGATLSWLEEDRFEWSKTTAYALSQILNGKTVILITDEKRKWLEQYILTSINSVELERPIVPIVSIDSLYPHFNNISGGEMIDLVEGMIFQAYKEDCFFWYIGKGDDKRSDIAKRKDESYFWIFDEDFNNAFTMKSYDSSLDIKLLQLFKLFNASLNATMFGEVDAGS
ncbi:DNA replication regulator family [hydrothermal vent metagenome]|uniref:DNA replication regulator family n=1 Tax=hydrothermal vent metagenome TaxID=652676 RepID=A0A1W1BTD1_9ZZZZ